MSERIEFVQYPPEPVRLAMCEWLRWHGIEPNAVCAVGWIERDPERRQVRYEAYARDEQGQLYPDETGDDAVREVHAVQLEAEPSPFPDVTRT